VANRRSRPYPTQMAAELLTLGAASGALINKLRESRNCEK
jgi:hypothetical protein